MIRLNNTVIQTAKLRNLHDTSIWGKVDLGELNWEKGSVFYAQIPNAKLRTPSAQNAVCSKYPLDKTATTTSNFQDKHFIIGTAYSFVYVKDSAYTNATAFKQAMKGVFLWYELASNTQPVKKDLSKVIFEGVEVFSSGNSLDLGTLEWSYDPYSISPAYIAEWPGDIPTTITIPGYTQITYNDDYNMPDKSYFFRDYYGTKTLFLSDYSYMTSPQLLKEHLSGVIANYTN